MHTDLFETSQSIISALASYITIIAENGNIYLMIEKTHEDYFILDSLMGEVNLSDAAISQWLIDRFLGPLQIQMQTWPFCLLFAREFRETMASKMIVIQTLRNRVLPPVVARALTSGTSDSVEWHTAIERSALSQRKAALQLLQLEAVEEETAFSLPYNIDVLQAALATADEFSLPGEKKDVGLATSYFADAKEYSVRLRAVLYKIVDEITADSMEAKETTIPRVKEWSQKVFFGSSIESRDRAAAQSITAEKGNAAVEAQLNARLGSIFGQNDEIMAVLSDYQRRISKKIMMCAKTLSFYPVLWQSASVMQRNASRVISRCMSEPDNVAREILASDVLWIAQIICATFPEADNACLVMLQQISTLGVNAPFHFRALLDRDPVAIIASIAQAEALARSELDQLADVGEATEKIPDAAQDNPWHGWSIFASEPPISPPPQNRNEWSDTAKEQLKAAGIDPFSSLVEENRSLGNMRFEMGCFAMPNIGLVTGMLQELLLRDGNNVRDPRSNLLAYLIAEVNWVTGRPLNGRQSRMDELVAAMNLGIGGIGSVSPSQFEFRLSRNDWYSTLLFALGMTCIGPAASSLLATCIGNHLVHQSDGIPVALGIDDPYLTAGIRVLTSKYPRSIMPPNVNMRRARTNFGMLLSIRYLQSLPRNEYENLRIDTLEYYANEHAFYVSPTCVSSRFAFLHTEKEAVDDVLSSVSYASPN